MHGRISIFISWVDVQPMQETLTLTILILDLECGSKVDLFWTYITAPLCTHRAYVSQMQIPHLNSELGVSGLPAQAVS